MHPPTHPPTQTPAHPPTQTPAQPPTHPPTQTPAHPPTQTPAQPPTQTPAQTPTQTPMQTPAHTPMQTPAQTPTQTPMQTPAHPPTQTPTHPPTRTQISACRDLRIWLARSFMPSFCDACEWRQPRPRFTHARRTLLRASAQRGRLRLRVGRLSLRQRRAAAEHTSSGVGIEGTSAPMPYTGSYCPPTTCALGTAAAFRVQTALSRNPRSYSQISVGATFSAVSASSARAYKTGGTDRWRCAGRVRRPWTRPNASADSRAIAGCRRCLRRCATTINTSGLRHRPKPHRTALAPLVFFQQRAGQRQK